MTLADDAIKTDTSVEKISVEKKDNNNDGIPGVTLMVLIFSLSVVTIYEYSKRIK